MVTQLFNNKTFNEYRGLAEDDKPLIHVPNGSIFKEIDTGLTFMFDATATDWVLQPSSSVYKTTVLSDEASDTDVPSAKAVVDYVASHGVSPDAVQGAVDDYLTRHPIDPGDYSTDINQLKSDVNTLDSGKADKATTYTKTEVDAQHLDLDERKANVDGYYSDMAVGLAENLISPDGVIDEEPYIYRTTAGEQSVTDGFAEMRALKGNTVVWNQLLNSSDYNPSAASGVNISRTFNKITITGSVTSNVFIRLYNRFYITNGHIYYIKLSIEDRSKNLGTSFGNYLYNDNSNPRKLFYEDAIYSENSELFSLYLRINANSNVDWSFSPYLVDLTQMFGAGKEPASTSDPRIAWLESELEKNPSYNEGELLNVDVDSIKTVGFNMWDGDVVQGYHTFDANNNPIIASHPGRVTKETLIKVVGGQKYYLNWNYNDVGVNILKYDANNKHIEETGWLGNGANEVTLEPDCAYVALNFFKRSDPSTFNPTQFKELYPEPCFNRSWSGYRNGEYEPYTEQIKPLPPIKEIEDADGNKLFPYGLLSAGNVRDEITPTKAIKRIGVVDLGTLNWYISSGKFYSSPFDDGAPGTHSNLSCAKYLASSKGWQSLDDKTMNYTNGIFAVGKYSFAINDSAYTAASDFKTAMNGVIAYYELVTPIEVEFNEPYNMTYRISDFGTEEFISSSETSPQTAPVAHETFYMQNLRDEVRRLPNNYQSQDSMNNLLSSVGQALGYSINATWDEPTKAYKYVVNSTYTDEQREDAQERLGIVVLTQEEYDLIEVKSESTLYFIKEA